MGVQPNSHGKNDKHKLVLIDTHDSPVKSCQTSSPRLIFIIILLSRGLKVHIWVCRNEPEYLLWDYGLDPYREYEDLIKVSKVDGIFTDFPWSLKNYMEMTDLNCS